MIVMFSPRREDIFVRALSFMADILDSQNASPLILIKDYIVYIITMIYGFEC
jgi:hypothetical protein